MDYLNDCVLRTLYIKFSIHFCIKIPISKELDSEYFKNLQFIYYM